MKIVDLKVEIYLTNEQEQTVLICKSINDKMISIQEEFHN